MSLFERRRKDVEAAPPPPRVEEQEYRPEGADDGVVEKEAEAVLPPQLPPVEVATKAPPPPKEETMASIGKSIRVKGDLSGEEDVLVDGHVEGKIELPGNQITIGAEGSASAEVHAKKVVIIGKITGNVSAGERIEIQSTGIVDGDVQAPRLVVEEGAVVNGSISMDSGSGTKKKKRHADGLAFTAADGVEKGKAL